MRETRSFNAVGASRTGEGLQNRAGRVAMLSIVLSIGAATIAGCSPEPAASNLTDPDAAWQGGEATSSEMLNSPPPGAKNISTWALPLDEFMPRFSNLDNYAEQLMVASCLEPMNIDWPVPWQDIEEPISPVYNPVGRRLFNLKIAEQYGFRTNLEPSKSTLMWGTFLEHEPTEPGFQEAFDGCLANVRQQYPLPDVDDTWFAVGLSGQIQVEASLAAEVKEAAIKWASCMEKMDVGQLPENPVEFPSTELQQELGALPPVQTPDPSAREMEVAIAHATCLDSSGFSQISYEKEWELQSAAIEGARAKLDRIRDELHARETTVQEIIAANAPRA